MGFVLEYCHLWVNLIDVVKVGPIKLMAFLQLSEVQLNPHRLTQTNQGFIPLVL